MNRCVLQHFIVLSVVGLLLGCSSTNNKPLLIGFSKDSSAIVFNHIDRVGLTQLKGVGDSILEDMTSVLEMPAEMDTTFKERVVKGRFLLTDSSLVFLPEQLFVKGRSYLVITHLNSKFGDVNTILKGELSTGIRPLQQVLVR